jgi:2-amino-4-hydroxy-6-hydroxymethyldihydropteridine diphosphokinase
MNRAYLLLGSNLGNPKGQLKLAENLIKKRLGAIVRKSALYQTAAWGKTDQPDLINQVFIVETKKTAGESIAIILDLEKQMGRVRSTKNAARIIDIDILYFNKELIDLPHLQVPHPAIAQRRFVLTPLNELSPQFIHPVLGKTNHQLLLKCPDKLDVKKI